eukprot:s561_g6.t1
MLLGLLDGDFTAAGLGYEMGPDVPGKGGTLKGILGAIPYAAKLLEGSGILELAAGQPVLTGTGQRAQGRPGGRRRRGCQLILEAGRINASFACRALLGVRQESSSDWCGIPVRSNQEGKWTGPFKEVAQVLKGFNVV